MINLIKHQRRLVNVTGRHMPSRFMLGCYVAVTIAAVTSVAARAYADTDRMLANAPVMGAKDGGGAPPSPQNKQALMGSAAKPPAGTADAVVPNNAIVPEPVVVPVTIGSLSKKLAEQDTQFQILNRRLDSETRTLEQIELEHNEVRDLEARLKKAIILETDNFLTANEGRASAEDESLRTKYLSQVALRKTLDQRLSAAKLSIKKYSGEIASAKAELAKTQAALAGLENAKHKLAIINIRKQLPRSLSFSEAIDFKCSPLKGISSCLADKDIQSNVEGWLVDRYAKAVIQQKLAAGQNQVPSISPSQFSFTFTHTYTNASMTMDGRVSANVSVQAAITPKLALACAVLSINPSLCSSQMHTLTVRSNMNNDSVAVGGTHYGSTPLVLVLASGEHNIQLTHEGKKLERSVSLDADKLVNFKF